MNYTNKLMNYTKDKINDKRAKIYINKHKTVNAIKNEKFKIVNSSK